MNVLGILQARTSSSRLPGKVFLPILGKPMLALQLERLQRCSTLDKLIVATSDDVSDDALESLCNSLNVTCYRGSLDDVLNRFVEAGKLYNPDVVVRLTGDCPLADPELIDEVVNHFLASKVDYLSNCEPATFPDGLDVEVTWFKLLEQADQEAVLPSHREHVTPFIRKQPDRFHIANFTSSEDRSGLRWTVDEAEDFEYVKKIYEYLYPDNPEFATNDVLSLLEKKMELNFINNKYNRNEGSRKSLEADAKFLIEKE